MLRFTPLSLLLSLLCLAPACGVSPNANEGDEVSSELRALRSNEIIGTLAYGQTSDPVDYTNTPLYRAFQFQGTAGDQVDVWVRSGEGDARAWIVNASFKNVATNDNADGSTRDAHMTATLSKSGTHYIVFREKSSDDASFTVSLAQLNGGGGSGGGGNDSGSPNDPFSTASCTGANLTAAQALAMLDVSRGVVEKKVGRFSIHTRARRCYPGQACSTWSSGESEITAPFPQLSGVSFTTNKSEANYRLHTVGDVIVSYENNAPKVRVRGDDFGGSAGASLTPNYWKEALELDRVSPGTVNGAGMKVSYLWQPSLGCPNGHCIGNANVPGTSTAAWAGGNVGVSGAVKQSCLRFTQSAKQPKKDANQNDYTLEEDLVIAGSYATSACRPKTCAEASATCGSLDDGCGSTLNCGTCAHNELCDDQQGPAHCRVMTSPEQCSRSGRVWCEGRGCYDACSPW